MADLSYTPLIYRTQGSTEFVVASSGLMRVEDGGSIDIESGGGIDIQSGGDITIESGGSIVWPVSGATSSASGSTTLTTISADGVSFITCSGDKRKITISDPYPGAQKLIYNTAGSTLCEVYISVGSAGIISTEATSTAHMMVIEATTQSALAGWCHLTGKSTDRWIRTAYSPTSQWVIVSTSS